MPKAESGSRLATSFNDVRELGEFIYALVPELARRKLRKGEDISPIVKEMGLQVPDCVRGATITWPGALRPKEREQEGIVIALPRPASREESEEGDGDWCLDIPITEPIGVNRVCLHCRDLVLFIYCWIDIQTIYPG
jgi:hypothetical protein